MGARQYSMQHCHPSLDLVRARPRSNVETFIVFRSSTPLVISLLDYLFLGRTWPTARSWLALGGILVGAIV
jgi:solute carrier family 35 protein